MITLWGNVMSTARRRSSHVCSLSSFVDLCRLMSFNWLILWIFLIREAYRGECCDELGKLSNTTYLLDTLLSEDKYDRKIRPGLGGPPIVIDTNLEIRSFGPISESEMVYSMDCYFRQKWSDSRLQFHSHQDQLSMDWKFLQKVWIPDTVFLNGKSSYLHKVTVPNKFIRLHKNGLLSYSMRLTVKASCPMHLRKYPLDTQACPLEIGSYAYPSEDVIYKWSDDKGVILSKDVVLSQYNFVNITTSTRINIVKVGERTDQRSILVVYFIIQRRRGYFILQIYAPCAMIVGASWVSFWINRSDAAGRVAVGATTVLTMVTMGFGGRGREKVGSATAIDWFVIMCFTFVFSALVEYAFVNYIDNYEKQQAKKQLELDREKKKKEEAIGSIAEPAVETHVETSAVFSKSTLYVSAEKENHVQKKTSEDHLRQKQKELQKLIQGHSFSLRRRPFARARLSLGKRSYRNRHIASKVDSYARIVFPVTFAVLNFMYWILFLLIMDDEISLTTHANPYA